LLHFLISTRTTLKKNKIGANRYGTCSNGSLYLLPEAYKSRIHKMANIGNSVKIDADSPVIAEEPADEVEVGIAGLVGSTPILPV